MSDQSPKPPTSLDDLHFTPQKMVAWFSPTVLIKAGIEALLSAVFGAYADKRELDAVLKDIELQDYCGEHDEDGIWIDYIADIGDGWDASYTMARLLAEEHLHFDNAITTQRGRILIMGGDQVYPTAHKSEYDNRTVYPYSYALPYVKEKPPHLYAVPGNHDWYDGLTNFRRLFMQKRWLGGWQSQQDRSYFAFKIAANCWVWGIDIQLQADIDQPQLDFFTTLAADETQMPKGCNIILCTAEPSWVYYQSKGPDSYANLHYLERKILHANQHKMVVALAGDLHNYTRYEHENGCYQRIIAGGGGAYLYPTHDMPTTLELPPADAQTHHRQDKMEHYKCQGVYPEVDRSVYLSCKSLAFPFYNWSFASFLGGFYLLIAWMLQSASKNSVAFVEGSYLDVLKNLPVSWQHSPTVAHHFIDIIAHSPGSVLFLLLLLYGMISFVDSKKLLCKITLGGAHALGHIALLNVFIWLCARVNLSMLEMSADAVWQVLLFGTEMLLVGGFFGGILFGLYFLISNRLFKIHTNEVLLCQSSPHYKNFLRLHLRKDTLTIYPIGVATVPSKRTFNPFANTKAARLAAWVLQTQAAAGKAWFEPKGDKKIGDYAALIEKKPIVIKLSELP
ncbi:MAG: metallophosphoesterase [Cellvibrionaceae bacterium]|nr:metallophosphoesterase [Cellvibrionaceae bacterium]